MKYFEHKKPERGTIIVEFAIVLPVLLLFLMATIELGLLFYNKQVLTNASREGARAGIARLDINDNVLDVNDIDAVVDNYCSSRMITFNNVSPAVNTTTVGLGGAFGDPLTVTVSYNYNFLVPQLLGFGTGFQLTAESMMRMERILTP